MSHVEEAEGAALVEARRARVHRARLLAKLRGDGDRLRGNVAKLAADEEAATTLPKI